MRLHILHVLAALACSVIGGRRTWNDQAVEGVNMVLCNGYTEPKECNSRTESH